ncbi:MAG: XdhC family protein [Chloroflexota bacterium]
MTVFSELRKSLEEEHPVTVATVIAGPGMLGAKLLVRDDGSTVGDLGRLTAEVIADARMQLAKEQAVTKSYSQPTGVFDIFIDVFPVKPRLVIIGATHTAIPLSRFAHELGYHVTVSDARAAFAVPERFPQADRVLKGWPQDILPTLNLDERSYVVLLSHDPKFDEPALEIVIPSSVPYIGAIGSRKTQRDRFARLRDNGFSEEQLARVYGPVGLDIGGTSVEETALAILAEITAVRRGRTAGFMKDRALPAKEVVSSSSAGG